MKFEIEKDKLGFYSIKNKPSKDELTKYYSLKYFNQKKNYLIKYSKEEIQYKKNKLNQKFLMISSFFEEGKNNFLELGSGEGFVLKKFYLNNFNVKGIDYSIDGVKNQNPDMLKYLVQGDLEDKINLVKKNSVDVLWIENVLEHVISPKEVIFTMYNKLSPNGLLAVSIPNDFSVIQKDLVSSKFVKKDNYWLAYPDHLTYFDYKSLLKTFNHYNFELLDIMSDYPIEFDLYCDASNYIDNKQYDGKSSHLKRIKIENMLSSISDKKVNQLYRDYAKLGVGRSFFAVFKKSNKSNVEFI